MDKYGSLAPGLTAPADEHFAITPADGVDLASRPRAIVALTAGNVAVRDRSGAIVIYPVFAGQILDFRAQGIEATGTTATVVGWV